MSRCPYNTVLPVSATRTFHEHDEVFFSKMFTAILFTVATLAVCVLNKRDILLRNKLRVQGHDCWQQQRNCLRVRVRRGTRNERSALLPSTPATQGRAAPPGYRKWRSWRLKAPVNSTCASVNSPDARESYIKLDTPNAWLKAFVNLIMVGGPISRFTNAYLKK
eukprot:3141785-Pleurochrysis_carterae.AAC.2